MEVCDVCAAQIVDVIVRHSFGAAPRRSMKIFCPGIYLVIIFGLVFWTASRDLSRAASGEVIITHASMSTSSIPLWVAARQNFFSKYGVKAKTVWVRGNPAQIATLVSGDTQIAYGGAPTAMAAAVGGR